MIYSHQWTDSGRFMKVVALALALAALTTSLILFPTRPASAQTQPTADYRFQDTRSTSVGTAPALTDIGSNLATNPNTFEPATVDGALRKVLRFPQGNGVKLSPTTGVVSNGTYTVVALFEFDDVTGYRRILDFKNGTNDNGLYVNNGNLEFYRTTPASGTGTPMAANTYVQVVLTRDSSGTVVGYVNGVQQFSFSDALGDAVIDTNNTLRFFRDNESDGVTTEHSAGSVARIRLYDTALDADEVEALDRREPSTFVVNATGDENDLNFPGGVPNGSPDSKCDVNASDGDQCTLRAAIQQANAISGKDAIDFNITGTGVKTIAVASQLPPITDAVTINGYSQPGASPNTETIGTDALLLIELNGQNAGTSANGLRLQASDSTIKGMVINRFSNDGIYVTGNKNIIEGN